MTGRSQSHVSHNSPQKKLRLCLQVRLRSATSYTAGNKKSPQRRSVHHARADAPPSQCAPQVCSGGRAHTCGLIYPQHRHVTCTETTAEGCVSSAPWRGDKGKEQSAPPAVRVRPLLAAHGRTMSGSSLDHRRRRTEIRKHTHKHVTYFTRHAPEVH